MPPFSERTQWESTPNALSEALAKVKQKGAPIFDLTLSNPTQAKFRYLSPDFLNAFLSPDNLSYTPDPRGLLKTREAVCSYYAEKGVLLSPDQILLTANTSEAYSLVLRLIGNPGESVLAPSPSYPLLDYLANLNDIRLIRYPLNADENWRLQLSGHESQAKAMILVHPNNPTGSYVHSDELDIISAAAKKSKMALIVDEVFFDFEQSPANEKAPTFAGHQEVLTFTLSGVSKILGLPQMKLSWIVVSGPAEMRDEALRRLEIINDTYLSASTPAQNAFPEWLKERPKIHQEINARVTSNLGELKKYFGNRVPEIQGGWHGLVELPSGANDEKVSLELLTQKNVLTHPGYLFDFEAPYLILSLLPEIEVFSEGIKRMRDYFKESQLL